MGLIIGGILSGTHRGQTINLRLTTNINIIRVRLNIDWGQMFPAKISRGDLWNSPPLNFHGGGGMRSEEAPPHGEYTMMVGGS